MEQARGTALLVRYELLTASSEMLDRMVRFVDVKPKLTPRFVHLITRFDNFVKEGERRFYREDDNQAWKRNEE
jgi:hypothetical protein